MTHLQRSLGIEEPPKRPRLIARGASFGDVDAFLDLARLRSDENGEVFDEAEARYVFAGLPRADPAVNLLFDGEDAIGFALVALRRMPLTSVRVGREELIYLRPDRRSSDAELLLHEASQALFDAWDLTIREMTIPASAYANEIAVALAARGYQPVVATTRCVGRTSENTPDSSRLN